MQLRTSCSSNLYPVLLKEYTDQRKEKKKEGERKEVKGARVKNNKNFTATGFFRNISAVPDWKRESRQLKVQGVKLIFPRQSILEPQWSKHQDS